jgi:hypothetical protein
MLQNSRIVAASTAASPTNEANNRCHVIASGSFAVIVSPIAPIRSAHQHVGWRITQDAPISRPTSFLSRPRGPTWTSRRPTRSGRLRSRWQLQWLRYACAFPSACVELGEIGLAYLRSPECEVVHRCATFFEARPRKAKKMASKRPNDDDDVGPREKGDERRSSERPVSRNSVANSMLSLILKRAPSKK